jgi:hypothetical protein
MMQLASALILPCFYYCSVALPVSTVAMLQRVQIVAVRLVFGLYPSDHITSAPSQLYWLPFACGT